MGAATTAASAPPGQPDVACIATLLDRVKHRDPAALRALYVAYSRRVHSYALQVLRDEHAAQDVVQDVFIRVWRYAGSYDAAKSMKPEAWLFQMTRNVALDEAVQRSRMVHVDVADQAADDADVPGAAEAPQPSDCADTRGEAFGRAMQRLPSHCRQVLHLRFHQGMSNPEIARHLGVPLGTAKTWLRRGLLQMRESLNVVVAAGQEREEWI